MFKLFTLTFLLVLFSACSQKIPSPNPSEKAFDTEDTYIIFALRAEQVGDYKSAARLFKELYEKSLKKEYLYRYLKDEFVLKKYLKIVNTVDKITHGSFDDVQLVRLKIVALIELDRVDEAKKLVLLLAPKTNKAEDYILAADVYVAEQQYEKAVHYLETVYRKDYNEKIIDKIATILYVNLNKKEEAVSKLESHSRMHGCSKLICQRLLYFYSHDNNIDGLLSVYKRLYAQDKSEAVAKKIIQIYSYKREYVQLMNFLEENKIDDDLLLQLYLSGKNWKKASELALKLYKESGDYSYLGQSAIYDYESYRGKVPQDVLKRVIAQLEEVVKYNKETLYMNYLGYILIDHDIDVKKGIAYIKEVLKKEPNSAYYLDSLAWGYYKLGECYKAKKIIDKVIKLDASKEPEVQEHLKMINQCIKKHK